MIYRSNLTCPDLSANFALKSPPLQHCGHDMPSDPDFLPGCGFWTHDEAAILYNVVKQVGGTWLDIGSRLGWTGAHILEAGAENVWCVDPEYAANPEFFDRAMHQCPRMLPVALTSEDFFRVTQSKFDGAVIDGCHDSPVPTEDAICAASVGARVILFHDFQGSPVREAVTRLLDDGWKASIYNTPNFVAVCWLDDSFIPPDHLPDPAIPWADIRSQVNDFDFSRTI